jgi:hypothetical protein
MTLNGTLVRYDTMCRAIEAAHEVDEVKDIRDKAVALEHYARQAQNTDAERQAWRRGQRLQMDHKFAVAMAKSREPIRGSIAPAQQPQQEPPTKT